MSTDRRILDTTIGRIESSFDPLVGTHEAWTTFEDAIKEEQDRIVDIEGCEPSNRALLEASLLAMKAVARVGREIADIHLRLVKVQRTVELLNAEP